MTEDNKDIDHSVRNAESIGITLKKIVSEIAEGVSSSDFQLRLTPFKDRPSTAQRLYNIQTADIIKDNHQLIDTMYDTTKLDLKYNEITHIINSTSDKNHKAWRPIPGNCDMQLVTFKRKSMLEMKNRLENMVREERDRKIQLKKSLDLRRARLRLLLQNMRTAKAKFYRNSENYITE